ncbi:MAG: elongation factor P [Patescibacteria group bacterium]
MSRLSYNELKIGTIFIKDGEPWKVIEYAFVRMQQRKPVVQLKIENLVSGKVVDYSAHQNEEYEEAEIDTTTVIFIYQSRGEFWFNEKGNPKNRFTLSVDVIGKAAQFLKTNLEVTAYKFGDKVINVELPIKMDLKVIEAPPAVKGNTAQGGTKVVTLETGAKVDVPLFINEGDILRINTTTGEYVERVEKV